MDKIFIVHFQLLEKYPPVINLIRFLAEENRGRASIHIISTNPGSETKLLEVDGIYIHRLTTWKKQMNRRQRLLLYLNFNRQALSLLRKHKPQKVLYFETLSAFAPCVYKKYFNKSSQLYIHYHEYTSAQEYKNGMVLTRYLHKLEQRLYKHTEWVSHTNEYRLNLFKKDVEPYLPPHTYVLPNYPTSKWKTAVDMQKIGKNTLVRFVYVGAIGLDTMYVEEFARFIKEKAGNCTWDIYSDNYSTSVTRFLDELRADNIHFKGKVEYDELPGILPAYDTGVILYKGHIPNYVYNAPNKLFEYLACGLNVWFPDVMKGCLTYVNDETYPAVKAVNFNDLNIVDVDPADNKQPPVPGTPGYYCERVLPLLTNLLLN